MLQGTKDFGVGSRWEEEDAGYPEVCWKLYTRGPRGKWSEDSTKQAPGHPLSGSKQDSGESNLGRHWAVKRSLSLWWSE